MTISAAMSNLRGRELRRLVMSTGMPAAKVALYMGVAQAQLSRAMRTYGTWRIPAHAIPALCALVTASLHKVQTTLKEYST